MHMISKKGLNDAEMDTLTKSSNDSHQWRSADATVYVKELDFS